MSKATVSRVLTGNAVVTPEKRDAVLTAMADLSYRPNLMAKGLAWGRTFTIGVVTPDLASPLYGLIMAGVEAELHLHGYQALFASGAFQPEPERTALEHLVARQVDAAIVLGGRLPGSDVVAAVGELPLVTVLRGAPDRPEITIDNRHGARIATQHLLSLGHRDVVHITGEAGQQDTEDRLRGYREAMAEAGLPPLTVPGGYHEEHGVRAVERLLAEELPCTAIFAPNDQVAVGVRLALADNGIAVPEDVSLVGFDDLPSVRYAVPPLTTVRQPAREMGRAAARAVLALLDGETVVVPEFRPELVVRSSTTRLVSVR
ncbi:LacI family transcriptional regulator [Crossiella equi]|uniref:LacI family transcriptional regulator n=1 Tax=Crossiella equi TaxID=130796 RepID=A0ABS5A515_9PSEU|nr:LacI family transcriptional regulator [Crossiella equi]